MPKIIEEKLLTPQLLSWIGDEFKIRKHEDVCACDLQILITSPISGVRVSVKYAGRTRPVNAEMRRQLLDTLVPELPKLVRLYLKKFAINLDHGPDRYRLTASMNIQTARELTADEAKLVLAWVDIVYSGLFGKDAGAKIEVTESGEGSGFMKQVKIKALLQQDIYKEN